MNKPEGIPKRQRVNRANFQYVDYVEEFDHSSTTNIYSESYDDSVHDKPVQDVARGCAVGCGFGFSIVVMVVFFLSLVIMFA